MPSTFSPHNAFERRAVPRTAAGATTFEALLADATVAEAAEEAPAGPAPIDAEVQAAAIEPDVAIAFAEDELPALLAAAARDARAVALADAAADAAATGARAATAIGETLAEVGAGTRADAETIYTLVRHIVGRIVPRALDAMPLPDLTNALAELLARTATRAEITVAVHPDVLEPLRGTLPELVGGAGFAGDVRLVGVADVPPGDARATWTDGEANRSVAALTTACDDLCAAWLDANVPARPKGPEDE
ncbi:MAG: hypothetical protein AAFX81_10420 [Pseudomonadota bacterium]